jgi:hypothetical protein
MLKRFFIYVFFQSHSIFTLSLKVKNHDTPAEAGVQNYLLLLDPSLRGNDNLRQNPTFYETVTIHAY